jgi:outer membrane protein insertion porin family
VDGISRTLDVYYQVQWPINYQFVQSYKTVTPGASIRFGVPFNDFDTVYFGLGIDRTELIGDDLPQELFNYVEFYGRRSVSVPFTVGWGRDTRDNLLTPSAGRYLRFNLDWGVAGQMRYLRTIAQAQQYIPLGRKFTLGLNGEVDYGHGGQALSCDQEFLCGRARQRESIPTQCVGACGRVWPSYGRQQARAVQFGVVLACAGHRQ